MERKACTGLWHGPGQPCVSGEHPAPVPCPCRELPPLLVRKLMALLPWLIGSDCSTLIINCSPPRCLCGLLAEGGQAGCSGGPARPAPCPLARLATCLPSLPWRSSGILHAGGQHIPRDTPLGLAKAAVSHSLLPPSPGCSAENGTGAAGDGCAGTTQYGQLLVRLCGTPAAQPWQQGRHRAPQSVGSLRAAACPSCTPA